MDTKLKTNTSIKNRSPRKFLQLIALCFLGFLLCLAIFYLFDVVWNGYVANWSEEHNMITHKEYSTELGTYFVRQPNWYKVKILIFKLLCFIAISGILIVWVVSNVYANLKVKRTITAIGEMLHDSMQTKKETTEIFPKEYAEIAAQVAEIKATIQQHEQILKEETTRKNDLIAYLAHDLKTPLTSVIGYLSLLDEAPDMPDLQKRKYIQITLDKSLRLEKLINEFFDITRYNLQQIALEKESIDLYYMLVQMTDEFYPLLNTHGNRTELSVDENSIIYGDSIKLARVFNNILKNAIAYSYPDTVIHIWAEASPDNIKIYFRNKGKTIPEQKLNSIFEKFFRLDEARTTNTGGAGLGLAIAREIVLLHGGVITAASENELTTFCVSLPQKQ